MGDNRNQTVSSHNPSWIYDVFLSFRGEDTRKNFTDHLYAALKQNEVFTFRDDEKLERGKKISPALLGAIEWSRFAVIVLSRNYATSGWCLDELGHILLCRKLYGLTVLPVFYRVSVSDVREQGGSIGEALAKHETVLGGDAEKVRNWRAAFVEVADLPTIFECDGDDPKVIKDVIEEILRRSRKVSGSISKGLIGIDTHVYEMKCLLLGSGVPEVCFIGIYGVEGIGKTTIARQLYDEISAQFEGKSFLANVREASSRRDLFYLQKQLLSETLMEKKIELRDVSQGTNTIKNRLSRKKILLVLDDVDQIEQLDSLAGNRDWFGPGSRIVVTSRDEDLLIRHGVDMRYKPRLLNRDESLQLFRKKAFRKDDLPDDYAELTNCFVEYAGGLPLAIHVMGSFLYRRSILEWKSALDRVRKVPLNGWKSLR